MKRAFYTLICLLVASTSFAQPTQTFFRVRLTATDSTSLVTPGGIVAGGLNITAGTVALPVTTTFGGAWTKGDLICGLNATTLSKLGIGADTLVLTADAASTCGVKWAASGSSNHNLLDGSRNQDTLAGSAVRGSMIVANSTPKWAAVVLGASATYWRSNGTDPGWTAIQVSDVPTLNQNTTGSAARWTTARNLAGNSVDGSANVIFSNKFIIQGTADAGLSGPQFLGALPTGIVKNTTTTGVLSIAVAGDFPTLNQNTTGSAATLTTPRSVYGNNFDGSAALTQIIAAGFGGTGNAFFQVSGPATSVKTFTFPNADSTVVTLDAAQSLTNKKLGSLTSNGFVKTSGGDGTLSVDTSTYLTGNQTVALSGDVSGSGATAITTTLANSGVTAATYGDATHVAQVVYDAKGRATSAVNVLITGSAPGGAAGGDLSGTYPNPALANIPSATPAAGSLLFTNIAAPSSPAAGKDSVFVDSTDLRLHDKNANGVIGTTVVADAGSSNNFLTAISTAGAVSKAQPSFSNISGSIATGQVPTLNQDTTGSAAKWTTARNLAGNSVDGSANATFANKFLVQGTSDSGLSAAQFMGSLGTGILKNTTTTGVLSIAVAGDFPTLNQNTTGSAATLTTPRSVYGNNFDGSAALAQIIASTFGGTGNGFAKLSGPTTSEKTFTLPNASAAILTDNALVTGAQGGTANGFFAVSGPATSLKTFTFPNTSASVLTDNALVTVAQGGSGVATAVQKTFFAGPTSGADTAPAFRTIAVADVPTLNQSTTGSAATLTTARTIAGTSFNGSANISPPSTGLSDTANIAYIDANNTFTGQSNIISKSVASASVTLTVRNTSNNNASAAALYIGNDGNASQTQFQTYSSTYSTSGFRRTNGGALLTSGPLSIVADGASNTIDFYTGSSDVLRLTVADGGTTQTVQQTLTANPASGVGDVYVCIGTNNVVHQGATCAASAARFKTNVASLFEKKGTAWDWVGKLRPVTFDWKHDGKPDISFIAEEVANVDTRLAVYQKDEVEWTEWVWQAKEHVAGVSDDDNPIGDWVEVVKHGKANDTTIFSVNDRAIIALLTKEVQDQHADILQLQADLKKLMAQVGAQGLVKE